MSFVESCNHFLSWSDQNFAKMSHEMWANHKVPIEDHYFMKFCFGATGVDRQFEWPGGGGGQYVTFIMYGFQQKPII